MTSKSGTMRRRVLVPELVALFGLVVVSGTGAASAAAAGPEKGDRYVAVGGNDIGYDATAVVRGDPTTLCSASSLLDANNTTARGR
jgi:hypothetical protein